MTKAAIIAMALPALTRTVTRMTRENKYDFASLTADGKTAITEPYVSAEQAKVLHGRLSSALTSYRKRADFDGRIYTVRTNTVDCVVGVWCTGEKPAVAEAPVADAPVADAPVADATASEGADAPVADATADAPAAE